MTIGDLLTDHNVSWAYYGGVGQRCWQYLWAWLDQRPGANVR
jgi:hypothetical protein